MSSVNPIRAHTRAANLSSPTAKSDRADAILRRMTDAIVADIARAHAERGQVIRDAVAAQIQTIGTPA